MNDYRFAFKAACADLGAIGALLGFEEYPGVDALLRSITELIASRQPEPRAEVTDAEVRALLQLEEAIRHDREMFEGTSDEDNPMGYLVKTALKVLDAIRTGASS